MLGTADYGARVRQRGRRDSRSTASSSTPRSPGPTACALLRNFVRLRGGRMILLPGDRHPRRQGRAAARRATSTSETVYDDDPLEAARSLGRGGRALAARRRPRRRARRRAREPRPPERITARAERPGAVRRRAARRSRRSAARSRRARTRVVLGTAAYTDLEFLDEALATVGRARGRGGRRARRPRVGVRLDEGDADARRGRDRAAAAARRARSSSTRTPTATACSRARTSTRSSASSRRVRGRVHLLGRDRLARRPARAARPAAGEPRRRDLRQGALRGPLHDAPRRRPLLEATAD